ncbi:hypothetical protein ACR9E3_02850 [Actinomycetospora sp. C-140]
MIGPQRRPGLPTPPLCERCWFPVRPEQPARRLVIRGLDGAVVAGFEHAGDVCTPQHPGASDDGV